MMTWSLQFWGGGGGSLMDLAAAPASHKATKWIVLDLAIVGRFGG